MAYEGITSFLHHKRHKALHKAVVTMENKVDLQRNKVFHLDNSMVTYGIYSSDTLEQLIDTVHKMHYQTTWMKDYLAVRLINGMNGIYPRME